MWFPCVASSLQAMLPFSALRVWVLLRLKFWSKIMLGTTRLHPASLEQAQAFVPSLAWRQHRQRPWQWQWHRAWPLPLGAPPQRNTESLITGMISCGWSGCVIGSRWGPCLVKSRGLRRKTVWAPLYRAAVACWKCKAPKLFFLSPA